MDRPRRIAVGGDALVDIVTYADGRIEAAAGGGPFNSARTMARLGAAVSFCGTLSTDDHGQLLADTLAADGVDLSLTRRSERPTPLARATLDAADSATYVFEFDGTAALDYPVAERPSLEGFAAFHVGTLGLVLEPMAATYRAMVADVGDDVLVVTDPNCRPQVIRHRDAYVASLAPVLARADVVKASTDGPRLSRAGRRSARRGLDPARSRRSRRPAHGRRRWHPRADVRRRRPRGVACHRGRGYDRRR